MLLLWVTFPAGRQARPTKRRRTKPSAAERVHRAATSALLVVAAFALPMECRAGVSGQAYVFQSASKYSFTVKRSAKEVRTGRTAAMHRSRPDAMPALVTRTQRVPGARGYERSDLPAEAAAVPALAVGITPGRPEYHGWRVTPRTMEALSVFWSLRAG